MSRKKTTLYFEDGELKKAFEQDASLSTRVFSRGESEFSPADPYVKAETQECQDGVSNYTAEFRKRWFGVDLAARDASDDVIVWFPCEGPLLRDKTTGDPLPSHAGVWAPCGDEPHAQRDRAKAEEPREPIVLTSRRELEQDYHLRRRVSEPTAWDKSLTARLYKALTDAESVSVYYKEAQEQAEGVVRRQKEEISRLRNRQISLVETIRNLREEGRKKRERTTTAIYNLGREREALRAELSRAIAANHTLRQERDEVRMLAKTKDELTRERDSFRAELSRANDTYFSLQRRFSDATEKTSGMQDRISKLRTAMSLVINARGSATDFANVVGLMKKAFDEDGAPI